jgi:3-methyladenine DNA glycosylase AlkD
MNDGRARFAFTDIRDAAAKRAGADGLRYAARLVAHDYNRTPDGWAKLVYALHQLAKVIEEDD